MVRHFENISIYLLGTTLAASDSVLRLAELMKNIVYNILRILSLTLIMSACQSSGSNGITNLLDPDQAEKEALTNQIEQVCFNLSSGVYMSEQNYNTENFPFYNLNAMELAMISGMTGMAQMLATMSGKGNSEISYEPKNIEITDFSEKEATAKYTLVMKIGDKEKQQDIVLNAKKIAGKWKLDGKQFFAREAQQEE